MGGIRGLEGPDDLDQLHDGHWIHEMHADDLIGSFGDTGQLGDGDGRGVAGDDGFGFEYLIESTKHGLLDVDVFDDGLGR
jgi:hypothetical protein